MTTHVALESATLLEESSRELCAWFQRGKRDLPWRRDRSAYTTLVSEFMLQQTTVKTVIPKFNLFVNKFSGFESLARASLDEVLSAWEGLGYYRRARFLHASAQQIVKEHGGECPSQIKTLMSLKGVGRYTAGAVASLAFNAPAPIVDGNIVRVFARFFGIYSRDENIFYQFAERWMGHVHSPALHNESLMELGALICLPQSPLCGACPLRLHCTAYRTEAVNALPLPKERPIQEKTTRIAVVVRDQAGSMLLQKIPSGELCHGQWSLLTSPRIEEQSESLFFEEMLSFLGLLNIRITCVNRAGAFTHSVYNERMRVQLLSIEVVRTSKDKKTQGFLTDFRWAKKTQLPRPSSTVLRKSLDLLEK